MSSKSTKIQLPLMFLAIAVVLYGCAAEETPVAPDPIVVPASASEMVTSVAQAYDQADASWLLGLLASDPSLPAYRFFPHGGWECPGGGWSLMEERELHERMFDAADGTIDHTDIPVDFRFKSAEASLTMMTPLQERPDFYQSGQNPGGVDPDRWKIVDVTCRSELFLELEGDQDFLAGGSMLLVIAEDLAKEAGEEGKFSILEWHDLGLGRRTRTAAVEEATWSDVKALYLSGVSRPEFCPASSPEDLVQQLAEAYRSKRVDQFESLLANGPGTAYLFITDPAAGEDMWGYDEETRIHQRMFEPHLTPPGQTPVPTEFWLNSITIALVESTPFVERPDLYQSASNPTGLDPLRWKASDAIYSTDVLFDTQGNLDFQVTARANFVVIEDLQKKNGEEGKFLLLQWNDLPAKAGVEETSWSSVKGLYN